MEQKKRKLIILIASAVLVLLLLAGGLFVRTHLRQLQKTVEAGDLLFSEGNYAEAIDTYGRLLEKTPLTSLGIGKQYPEIGADHVISCIDKLLETADGAHLLTDNELIEKTVARISHPNVPETLTDALNRRLLLGKAILAEESGDLDAAKQLLEQAQIDSEHSKTLSVSVKQQIKLHDALTAREEGRLEEAIALLQESGLQPELIAEIEQQIVKENDRVLIAEAQTALEALQHDRAFELLSSVTDDAVRTSVQDSFCEIWTETLRQLREQYADSLHAGAWYSLVLGKDPVLTGDRRYEDLKTVFSPDDTIIDGYFSFIRLNDGRVELLGDTLGAEKAAASITDAVGGALGLNHALILHRDGTVTILGAKQYDRDAVGEWTGITQVAAGAFHNVGLTEQGTVVAAGLDADGQCQVGEWTDVIAVEAGVRHTVALHRDGHVSATGDNSFGQCDVSDWKNVVKISCGGNFTVGLTDDFHVLATGDNGCGQCEVSGWEEVLGISAGMWHTVGLLSNGRVVVAGTDGHGQSGVEGTELFASDMKAEPPAGKRGAETEYLYIGDPSDGPWLYYNGEGCIFASFDKAYACKPTRADLICTYGVSPFGILAGGGDKPDGVYHAKQIAEQNHCVFALTGDYFTFGYNADGLQIRRGVVYKEEKDEIGFGFYPDGSMRLIDPNQWTADELLKQGVRDSWVFGPALMNNGEVLDITGHPLSYNDVTMRTVMASVCPYHHLAAAYGTSTLANVTETLSDYGCAVAYNLDGGRSSMMIFMDNIINQTIYKYNGWRRLQDMIGFLNSELVPAFHMK